LLFNSVSELFFSLAAVLVVAAADATYYQ